ncbi:hypothetical protein LUZ60_011113 [Juncus effusus]|nr:hypothetical protein LUZ60_011113 [Juncus effusus]
MNVVGKVGSLISQGVYSVATPFHPFGGAVDVIVVQQEDGTYRSTPWYVRFGKFQGVLKGAEKVVSISVNGIEAPFHMYLDNSGQAYFMREVTNGSESVKESEIGSESFRADSIQEEKEEDEEESYGFQEEGNNEELGFGSLEEEVEELVKQSNEPNGSNGSDGLNNNNNNSEVVLVSIDGHVLTAPIRSTEENSTENLDLDFNNPQFHLGPGESTSGDFGGNSEVWETGFIGDLDVKESHREVVIDEGIGGKRNLEGSLEEAAVSDDGADGKRNLEEVVSDEGMVGKRKLEEVVSDEGMDGKRDLEEVVSDGWMEGKRKLEDAETFKSCVDLTAQIEIGKLIEAEEEREGEERESEEREVEIIKGEDDGLSGDLVNKEESVEGELVLETKLEGEQTGEDEDRSVVSESPKVLNQTQVSQSPQVINLCCEISICGNLLRAGMGREAAEEIFKSHKISLEEFEQSGPSILKNTNLILKIENNYFPYPKAAHLILGKAAFGPDFHIDPKDSIQIEEPKEDDNNNSNNKGIIGISPSASRRWRLWPIPFRMSRSIQRTNSTESTDELFLDSEPFLHSPTNSDNASELGGSVSSKISSANNNENGSPRKQFVRANLPTNEQIALLNLKEGQNNITFSFTTRVFGKQQVDAHIYLWKWNARIVISDVDGTITKSDVLGQFMPLVGKDWTQSGVARLFSAIKENGYQLLFLSARAIVQAYLTRSFLNNLKQDGKALPNGPVVISPDGLFPSLYREVIRRAPHEFKIACLEDIKALFPSDYNPFYAGFGNRDTDELSYRKIGIPKGKIFIINPKGEVAINNCTDVKSYTSLHTLVNDMFPPTSLVEQEDFNAWNYWKMPLPSID